MGNIRAAVASNAPMARMLTLTQRPFLGTLTAVALLTGCAGSHNRPPPSFVPTAATAKADRKTLGTYVTVKEVEAMPPCTATFAKRLSGYSGSFTDQDGNEFVLGDIRGEQWVWHFVNALVVGTTYRFPEVLESYMNARQYVTAKEIAAMPACTATLAARSPCSSTFRTADGKWFGIGDPGSGAQISQFIWSLEDGATRKFPDAFLEYEKQYVPE
jgi:hypothetical protein